MLEKTDQVVSNSAVPINEKIIFKRINVIKRSRKQTFYRVFTVSSVAIGPLYSYFLWQSVCEAAEFAIKEFGGGINENTQIFIRYIAAPFVFANLISDMTSVNPLKDADELALPSQKEKTEIIKQALGIFLKVLALITSFPVGASADGIPIAYLAEKISNELANGILRYSGLAIVTILGVVYYMMFTNARIQKHVSEFIDTLKAPKSFLKNFVTNPGKYLEVLIQILFNSAYRGISFGYVMSDVLTTIFKIDNKNNWGRNAVLLTSISTFIITIFFTYS